MRQHSEACLRNREPLWQALRCRLPAGLILEIASGTGMHAAFFGARLDDERGANTLWQPSDPDPGALGSIAAWCEGVPAVLPPVRLDVTEPWPGLKTAPSALFCANMVHISPWACTLALLDGAARIVTPGGKLFLYGPFRRGGLMVPSNVDFDGWLKARNPAFGVRDLEAVASAAAGFALAEVLEMPANNLLTVWLRE